MTILAKKSLGQNFLIDQNYQRKIINSLEINPKTEVIEIGPGQGAITRHLIELNLKKLTLIEKDTELAKILDEKYKDKDHIEVIHADFLNLDLNENFKSDSHRIVVSNLPYNVSSQIFIKLLEYRDLFHALYLMFQKEVGSRLLAQPKTKDYGLLSLWCQIHTNPRKLFDLPPTVFKPKPRVWSSFLEFEIKQDSLLDSKIEREFWRMMKLLFQQRRKMILSILKKNISLEKIEVIEKLSWIKQKRAEELSVEELIQLVKLII